MLRYERSRNLKKRYKALEFHANLKLCYIQIFTILIIAVCKVEQYA